MISLNIVRMINNGLRSNFLVRGSLKWRIIYKLIKNYSIYPNTIRKTNHFRSLIQINNIRRQKDKLCFDQDVINHYFNQEYNILGTGWFSSDSIDNSTVVENRSRRVRSESNKWNIDVKTGYVFINKHYSSSLISGLPKGVDIKVPWELGRMHHWPHLALYSACVEDSVLRKKAIKAFKMQMLDFMVNNPIGEGVQFYCAMEVAIRAVNLLFAYDIFKQIDDDGILSEQFCNEFEVYLFLHRTVIKRNIEYDLRGGKNGNHYLSDLMGLLWIDMYYGNFSEFDKVKSVFYEELNTQFLENGSNYECSSGYHRLSAEISGLCLLAVMVTLGKNDVPREVMKKVTGMKRLLQFLVGIDGNLTQVGDFDSGKVLKLFPYYRGEIENTLISNEVINLLTALCGGKPQFSLVDLYGISSITDEQKLDNERNSKTAFFQVTTDRFPFIATNEYLLPDTSSFNSFELSIEEEFGMIKIIGSNIDLFIRIAPDYSLMNTAHAHDDIFHFEYCLPNKRFYPDCGSVAYTSNIEYRDFFSAATGHNVPIGKASWLRRVGMFETRADRSLVTRFCVLNSIIRIESKTDYRTHIREFVIKKHSFIVNDYSSQPFKYNINNANKYSFGYGNLIDL